MSDLFTLLKQNLGKKELTRIQDKIGADESATKKAIGAALPAMIGVLGRKASSPQGSAELTKVLNEEEQSGGLIGTIMGMLGGEEPEAEHQAQILDHVLGNRTEHVANHVSKASGLDKASIKKLLKVLAPILLGVLAKYRKSEHLDTEDAIGLLVKEKENVESESGGIIGKLLDQDGDDDFDLADVARTAASKLFG